MGTVKRGIMKDKGKSAKAHGEEEEKKEDILALTVVHMQGPFLLYAAGIIVSLIAFLFENFLIASVLFG